MRKNLFKDVIDQDKADEIYYDEHYGLNFIWNYPKWFPIKILQLFAKSDFLFEQELTLYFDINPSTAREAKYNWKRLLNESFMGYCEDFVPVISKNYI